jgi:hypothetical protein
VQNGSLSSSILLTCKSFCQITFSGCNFFQLHISTDLTSALNSAFFGYSYAKKN